MKKTILLFIIFCSISIYSQTDSVKFGWTPQGVAGLNLSQIAFTNWSQGGDNSISWTFFSNFGLNFKDTLWNWKNNLKLAYGRTKLGNADYRTNDNELYFESVLAYSIGWTVDPYFSSSVRTSLAPGYDYTDTAAIKIANFFDPGYVIESLGFTYNKNKYVSTRLGIALQETFTNNFTQYADDPATAEIEKFKLETGIESVTTLQYALQENLLYNSQLNLFTRFKQLDVWDVRWDNTVTAKINNYVNVNLNVLLIYQKSQSPKTQVKEALQLGFTYTIF
jgi:Protein of unknown function (DUF3078)